MTRFNLNDTLKLLAAAALSLLILLAAALAARAVGSVLVLFVLAAVLAFVLTPLVSLGERRLRMPRAAGIFAAYLLVVGSLGLLGRLLIPPLIEQGGQLVQLIPGIVRGLTDPASPWYAAAERVGLGSAMAEAVAAAISQLQGLTDDIARELFYVARGIGTALFELLLLFVVAFYMLSGRPRLASAAVWWLAPSQKELLQRIERQVADVLARYLRARLFLSVLVGIMVGVAAQLLGLRYPVLLGTLAGLFELIPFLGPLLGAIPAILVAAVQGPPVRVLAVIVAFVLIQQFEGNILAPRITSDAVRLPPLLVIFAVLAAGEIAGIWGALFVSPILGSVAAAGREILRNIRSQSWTTTPVSPSATPSRQSPDSLRRLHRYRRPGIKGLRPQRRASGRRSQRHAAAKDDAGVSTKK